MESSLIQYEQTNNIFLRLLKNNNITRGAIRNVLETENAFLVVPTSVSLEGVEITQSFLETHTLIFPEHPNQFVSLNGIVGVISENRELVHIIKGPPIDKAAMGPLFDISTYYRENRSHFQSLYESFDPSQDQNSIPLLREWKVSIGDTEVPGMLISEPITFEGCSWANRTAPGSGTANAKAAEQRSSSPVLASSSSSAVVQHQGDLLFLGSDSSTSSTTTAPSSHLSSSPTLSKDVSKMASMLTLLDFPTSAMQEKPPLFPPQEDILSPSGYLPSATGSTQGSVNNSPTNSPPGSPRDPSNRNLVRSASLSSSLSAKSSTSTQTMTANPSTRSNAALRPASRTTSSTTVSTSTTSSATTASTNNQAGKNNFFFQMMAKPEAKALVGRIKLFIDDFERKPGPPQTHSDRLHAFFNEMTAVIEAHPLWKGANEQAMEATSEGLEKYVISKLYSKLFSPDEEDMKKDREISQVIKRLQFITPEHLDIKIRISTKGLEFAAAELSKMNQYKSPKDKLVCIMNCCKIIYSQVLNLATVGPAGADEFLPILILTVLRSSSAHLHSNIRFISDFRNPSKLSVTELGYYFTQFVSAVSFIQLIDATKLSIDPLEFDRLFNANVPAATSTSIPNINSAAPGSISAPPSFSTLPFLDSAPSLSTSPSSAPSLQLPQPTQRRSLPDESGDSTGLLTPSASFTSSSSSLGPYRFLKKTTNDLTIGEVDELLKDYKTLVAEIERLRSILPSASSS